MTAAGAEYGGTLYELAAEEGLEEVILEQLTEVRRLLAENPDYEKLLAMPSVPKAERCAALDEAFGGQAEPYLVNFLKLLCEKGAIRTLPDYPEDDVRHTFYDFFREPKFFFPFAYIQYSFVFFPQ